MQSVVAVCAMKVACACVSVPVYERAMSTIIAASLLPPPLPPQSQTTRVDMDVRKLGATRLHPPQPRLCVAFNTCAMSTTMIASLTPPPPPQSQSTRVDIDVRMAGTTKVVFVAAETARRKQCLCDEHDHGSLFDASSSSAITIHASGLRCADGRNNQSCIRRSRDCAPNTVPVR